MGWLAFFLRDLLRLYTFNKEVLKCHRAKTSYDEPMVSQSEGCISGSMTFQISILEVQETQL